MKANLNTIKSAIADPKTKVVSFDVFDTLLVRPFWFPTDLFYFLDKELEDKTNSHGVINFSSVRHDAEEAVREEISKSGREDVTLQEIYDYIVETEIFPDDSVKSLMQKELELESRFCQARNSARKLVQFAVSCGKKVIATSDMYLPSDFIKGLLYDTGFEQIEKVYVSCECGVAKWTGRLYEYVAKTEHVEKNEIVHIGDNLNADVRIPRKVGVRAYPFYRTINLLEEGKAFKHAFRQMRSPLSNQRAMDNLGTRCLLAIVANKVYDDPFRISSTKGDYADDAELFGCLGLGMYSISQALWLGNIAVDENIDQVLFFARDGFLPYRGYELIQQYQKNKIQGFYVRTSRKALVPLLMSSEELLLTAGTHILYESNSPKSLTKLMSTVLTDEVASLADTFGESWDQAFSTELSMMKFLKMIRAKYLDKEKLDAAIKGYCSYFSPYMDGRILTYDIGYSLRNETILREFFPKTDITAACTHFTGDVPLKRCTEGGVKIRSLYPTTPYVTWLAREMFLIEDSASCLGYDLNGKPVMGTKPKEQRLLVEMHQQAISFMEEVTSIFREDLNWLPVEYVTACLPFEAFLHSPGKATLKWVKNLDEEDSFDTGVKDYKSYNFWRELRTDYWIARHHLGKYGRHAVRFLMLTYTDREELKQLIKKRLPKRFK